MIVVVDFDYTKRGVWYLKNDCWDYFNISSNTNISKEIKKFRNKIDAKNYVENNDMNPEQLETVEYWDYKKLLLYIAEERLKQL